MEVIVVAPVIVFVAPVITFVDVPAFPIVFVELAVETPMLLLAASILFVPVVPLAVILFVPFVPVAERVFDWFAALADITLLPAVAVMVLLPVVAVIEFPVPPVSWFCWVALRTLFVPAVRVFVAAACMEFVPPVAVARI